VVEFREAMLDAMLGAAKVKGVRAEGLAPREHRPNVRHAPPAMRGRELKAVIGEHRVDVVRHVFEEPA
jgi:hypothetical protein